MLAIFASLAVSAVVSANGSCGKLSPPKPFFMPPDQEFVPKNLTGLWFEHVDPPHRHLRQRHPRLQPHALPRDRRRNRGRKESRLFQAVQAKLRRTLLTDTSDSDILVFNHMHFPETDEETEEETEEEKKVGSFKQFKLNFDGPSFSFTRHETREPSTPQARTMHIAATDYGSFLLAASCRDENLEEG